MSKYTPTIGLEIHAELKTLTKMFCNSRNDSEEKRPNVNICPVCMGYPGTLPVINLEAVRQVIRVGTAAGGKVADYTEFDRKNYFYPDIPKGYQISQYKYPLISGGEIGGVKLTRIHLEEDTAKSSHESKDSSLVDFNRAGVPLMELVTEPVIHEGKAAADFAKELQLLLIYLGASEANMEKGEMRVEANVSVSAEESLGTKVEVKNLNSFKAVEKAINFEIKRQSEILERGEKVSQETRGWDENKEETFSQRQKEESHDYRYFPDPDLPKHVISEIKDFENQNIKKSLPELPWEKRNRLVAQYGVKIENANLFVNRPTIANYYEEVVNLLTNEEERRLAESYITSDIVSISKERGVENLNSISSARSTASVVSMIGRGEISSRGAKEIFKLISNDNPNADPKALAESNGLLQQSNEEELNKIVAEIIKNNEKVVSEFKSGNIGALQFLIGQGMKASKGSANPKVLKEIFEKFLGV